MIFPFLNFTLLFFFDKVVPKVKISLSSTLQNFPPATLFGTYSAAWCQIGGDEGCDGDAEGLEGDGLGFELVEEERVQEIAHRI